MVRSVSNPAVGSGEADLPIHVSQDVAVFETYLDIHTATSTSVVDGPQTKEHGGGDHGRRGGC